MNIALTDFRMLYGFCPVEEISIIINEFPFFDELFGDMEFKNDITEENLKIFIRKLFSFNEDVLKK